MWNWLVFRYIASLSAALPVVRQVEVQRALDAFEELEVHLRQVVVEHQRRDARLVHLEREHDQVEHQLHVIGHVLRQLVLRARHVRLVERRPPAFEPLFLRRSLDPLLDVADGLEVLAQLALSPRADLRLEALRVLPHRVENAAIERRPVPSPTRRSNARDGIDLLRRRLGRRDPRNARAVDHRQAVFEPQLVRLDAEHEARDGRAVADLRRR